MASENSSCFEKTTSQAASRCSTSRCYKARLKACSVAQDLEKLTSDDFMYAKTHTVRPCTVRPCTVGWASGGGIGRIEIPDEFGYYPEAATEHSEKRAATEHSDNDGWLPYGKEYAVDPNGEVTGFYMPDKELASAEQIKDDSEAWKTSFARDQRASFIQNHDHDCTGTCVKYQKKKNATEHLQRAGQKITGPGVPKCRFRSLKFSIF